MAEDDAWGDLFAKAADVGTSLSSDMEGENVMEKSKPTKGRKRKRDPKLDSNNNNSSNVSKKQFEAMLQSRSLSSIDNSAWPTWMQITEPILQVQGGKKCPGWTMASSLSLRQQMYSECAHCGLSALHHRLDVGNDVNEWPFQAFCELRNLRCTASWLSQQYNRTKNQRHPLLPLQESEKVVSLDSIVQHVSTGSNVLASLKPLVWRQLPEDEAPILESKLNDVLRHCNLLLNSMPQKNKNKNKKRYRDRSNESLDHWETSVRLVLACDALYYRMYYLQLVRLLPTNQTNNQISFLPHPSDYFGLSFLTLDVPTYQARFDNGIAILTANDQNESDSVPDGWWNDFTILQPLNEQNKEHPLAAIHRCRQMETFILFHESGWMASPKTQQLTLESLDKFMTAESKHETPGPNVLMEWRDGCRDFLCNVYAYATVPGKVLDRLVSFLEDSKVEELIEIGAGTGYIAKLLEARGVVVDPWDIHPTLNEPTLQSSSTMNEYHGNTPPFLTVKKGSQIPCSDCAKKALLLCYPPPGVPMAYDTLTMFLKQGGKWLIHIGEFKGLTGDAQFESLLLQEMVCIFRYPCLTWGTDASHVTVWRQNDDFHVADGGSDKLTQRLLLPCCHCQLREGVKRCRLLRNLVYCSKECFERDSKVRAKKLQLQWIQLKDDALNFDDPKHFLVLK